MKHIKLLSNTESSIPIGINFMHYAGRVVLIALTLMCGLGTPQLYAQLCTPAPTTVTEMRTLPTTCNTNDVFEVRSGDLWEFTINPNQDYAFTICPDGDGASTSPQADLYNTAGAGFIVSTGATDANGCVSLTYSAEAAGACTSPDNMIFLAVYSHNCLGDWEDWNLSVTTTCCEITCAADVAIGADPATCNAPAFVIPVPTVSAPCDATMVTYSISPAMAPAPTPASPIDLSATTQLSVAAGVAVGTYTITWTSVDCSSNAVTCTQTVTVSPAIGCPTPTTCPAPSTVNNTRTLSTMCDASETFEVRSGDFWEFTIDPGKNYQFRICPDTDGNGTPQADLFGDSAGTEPLATSSTVDANGCVIVTYADNGTAPCLSNDDMVYLAVYSHNCIGDWEDWRLEVTCICCTLTCAPDVNVASNTGTCTAPAFTIPVPSVSTPCDATMVSYAVFPAMAQAPTPVSPIDITTTTELNVAAGVAIGVYTITWTATDCSGATTTCEQLIYVEPAVGCTNSSAVACPNPPSAVDSTRVLPTTCNTTDNFIVRSGNFWQFTIDNGKNYAFKICYDGDGSTIAQADLYSDAGGTAAIGTTGSPDANNCVTVNYTDDGSVPCPSGDEFVYLAVYSHSCIGDWEDWNIEVSCTCCEITCAPDVNVSASQSTCEAPAFTIPAPSVTAPCDATMVQYSITPAMASTPTPASPINISSPGGTTALSVPAGVEVGTYTVLWTATDCSGTTTTCEQVVYVEPVMVCNDNVNVTLGTNCAVTITPDMILEAPCTAEHQFTVSINGVANNQITAPGVYNVNVAYTPTSLALPGTAADTSNPSYGISCGGTITVEDKSAPMCDIAPEDVQYTVFCGNTLTTVTPTFSDCSGLNTPTSNDVKFGECSNFNNNHFAQATDANNNGFIDAFEPTQIPVPTNQPASFSLEHVVVRTWSVTDALNNPTTSCSQYLYVWRPTELLPPLVNATVECNATTSPDSLAVVDPQYVPHYINPAYDASMNTSTTNDLALTLVDDNGNAFYIALTQTHNACKYSTTFEDTPLEDLCGNTEKFIRTWTIVDWCTGAVVPTMTQIIKTEDTTAPIWTACPLGTAQGATTSNPIVLNTSSTNQGACFYIGLLSAPVATDACGSVTYAAVINDTLGNTIATVSDLSSIVQMDAGYYDIDFTAEDACGNTTICSVFYLVADDDRPVAICDEVTSISLTNIETGTGEICASNLDSGSYDNCGIVSMQVKRMDADEAVPFTDCVEVSCNDITVMVRFRVTDAAGNANECMVEVNVQDKLGPFMQCPPNVTLNCTQDYRDLTLTGNVINGTSTSNAINGFAWDNCVLDSVTYVDAGSLTCGAGTITRTWTAHSGTRTNTCTQSINVTPINTFTVEFPADTTITTCVAPNSLGNFGVPTISNDLCAQIGISSTDQQFDIVQGACYKIFRTWTVVNWCVYSDQNSSNTDLGTLVNGTTYNDDGDGFFRYVQVIKVVDNNSPTFTDCPTGTVIISDQTAGCEGPIDISVNATDDCTATADLEYTFSIDLNNDGTIDSTGVSNQISGSTTYAYGTHLARFIVTDGCGNSSSCDYVFTIQDGFAPSIACHTLSVEIEEATNTYEIWASDYIETSGTRDNCTPQANLLYRIIRASDSDQTTPPTDSNLVFTCNDLVEAPAGTFNPTAVPVEIWVGDAFGNWDFCVTSTLVTDNSGACGTPPGPGFTTAGVAGIITTEFGEKVDEVAVGITSSNNNAWAPFMTNTNGNYIFDGLPMHDNYTLRPDKDVDPLNGVSTYDLVVMSQHILGINQLDTPYKLIAADSNNDGAITTFDIIELRQMILYVISDLPSNKSWRFVDASYVFSNPANPWTESFPETRNISNLDANEMEEDFIAIKIGDVTGDAVANATQAPAERSAYDFALTTADQVLTAGQEIVIPVSAEDASILTGLQASWKFDTKALDFVRVEQADITTLGAGNFGLNLLEEGLITFSWNQANAITADKDDVLFNLVFTATTTGSLSNALSLSNRYMAAEAYSKDLTRMDVNLQFTTANGVFVAENFELFQNEPNPFANVTTIGFSLPEAANAKLTIYDINGRVLQVEKGTYAKGYHEMIINKDQLTSGILYYQLDTPTHSATKKMIVID